MEGYFKSKEFLLDLEKCYCQDKEMILFKLKGVNINIMGIEEKLIEYVFMIREQLYVREEVKFDSVVVFVGIVE